MSALDVLQQITTALDQAGIAYMLSGSFASAYYGIPRSTQDIDLVIVATPAQLRAFVGNLREDQYYADVEAALEAHTRQSMLNGIDLRTGWKVDLIICKSRPFSQEEFRRRKLVTLQDNRLFIATAEDVIIAKLEWSKLARSQRQIEDVAAILSARRDSLEYRYLENGLVSWD